MKNVKILGLLLMLAMTLTCKAKLSVLSSHSPVHFVCQDYIGIPLYDWPRTLLSYPIVFADEIHSEDELDLFDNVAQTSVPFQLSNVVIEDGLLKSGVINFFAQLHSNEHYDYSLYMRKKSAKSPISPVIIDKLDKMWVITDGTTGVEVPVSGTFDAADGKIPAPLIAMWSQEKRIGNNTLHIGNKRLESIETDILEAGDLFVECGVRYTFTDDASYYVRMKMVQGYPFIILDEEMKNIQASDSVYVDMAWNGFYPTRRYGNWDRQKEVSVDGGLEIDKPIYTNWSQEDPHWTGTGWVENPSEQMIYRLLPFGGNSTREQVPVISFWETGANAYELGVFVYDHNRWNDLQYGIWQPTPALSVYFRYDKGELYFKYPLAEGSRSTAITLYNVKDKQQLVDHFNRNIDEIAQQGGSDRAEEMGFRYAMMLHRQYALLGLDKIKDWVLCYPEKGRHPDSPFAGHDRQPGIDEFYRQIVSSPMAYYMTGLNGFPGIHSISHRPYFGGWVEDYLNLYKGLNNRQRKTVDALFLLSAYVNTLEAMNAIRTSLAGTANMAADGWSVPGLMSFLYPEHPMAKEWADFFEKTLEIYGIFYTRPTVSKYESLGGRWVESLGVYNWAFLRPTSATNTLLQLFDGKNRFANEGMVQRGRWMLDMMTAPIVSGGRMERGYPPHGAHGGGRLVPRYSSVYQLADWLQYYEPMLSEHLYWTGNMGTWVEMKPTQTDWLFVHRKQYSSINLGTNPHLRSCKYTGHGIVLRAGVDTEEELSIHLNQVDKGPNYRWGHQGQGNSGGLYFYAKGKIYSGHENEVVGDHIQNNLDGVTNFGVMKNGAFCNIGMNELVAPLYDLGTVQLAELLSKQGTGSFAWPEYLSRSVMLVGTDYFLLYDQTGTNWRAGSRFSWFVQKQDEFPQLVFMGKRARPDHWSRSETNNSKGFYRDADGSLLTLVTHKKNEIRILGGKTVSPSLLSDISVFEFVPDDVNRPDGILYIRTSHSTDVVFRNGAGIEWQAEKEAFDGQAGVIRRMDDGCLQLALMKGRRLRADGILLELSKEDGTAITLTCKGTDNCKGRFKSDGKSRLSLGGVSGGRLYIDGIPCNGIRDILLPAGEHKIEYAKHVTPMPARVKDIEYGPEGALLYLEIPPSAEKVRIEVSTDQAKTWKPVVTTRHSSYRLAPRQEGKVHVRAVSVRGKKEADFAPEYPLYTTCRPPHYPEGLRLKLGKNKVTLNWGKVLGVKKYRVYRRRLGEDKYRLLYEGKFNSYVDDMAAGVMEAALCPGRLEKKEMDIQMIVYEYTVTAVDGYGESLFAPAVNTDSTSWANWYPYTTLKFKRTSAFWMEPYVPASQVPATFY